jgi:outer membrane protein insertion porin family
MNTCFALSRLVKTAVGNALLGAVLWGVFCVPYAAHAAVIEDIQVHGLYSMKNEELLDLLDISPGVQLDSERVKQGIKRAFLKGIFDDVSVESTDVEKTRVIIRVTERDVIRNVRVSGNSFLSGRKIKQLFLLKEGQIMRFDLLESVRAQLKEALAVRGFPRSTVDIGVERAKEPCRVNVVLNVDAGEPEKIKEIAITGISEDIRYMLRSAEGDVYDQILLREDIERIKAYYKKQGYFRPVVGPYVFKDGVLNLLVNPGKLLEISLDGNTIISKKTILREMTFFDVEDFSDELVEETVQRILSLYHKEGYPFVQVAPVITTDNRSIELSFFIFEGQQVKVRMISFSGISLQEKKLKEIMSLKETGLYNPDLLETDREEIEALYNALGYLNAKVGDISTKYNSWSDGMDISIAVDEGLRTLIGNVKINGTRFISEAAVREVAGLKSGDIYNQLDIADARHRIIEHYTANGFTDVTVGQKTVTEQQQVLIVFQIDEGEKVAFGKTIIAGNKNTKYEVIRRELTYREGEPFNYHLLGQTRQTLYRLGLFTDVETGVLDRYDTKKDVLMKMREGNAGAVEVGLGYADYERFRGFFDISYRNLWGMNRESSFRYEVSSLENRYILNYHEPWFLNIPLSFRTYLIREEKRDINIDTRETRYRLSRNSANAGLEKKVSDSVKTELYYEFSLVETFDVKPDVILSREDTGTLTISGLRPGIIFDTRDNPFNPRKGILSGLSLKVTSPVFFSETNFMKLIFHGSVYQQLFKGIVLAISVRGGAAQGYLKTDEMPLVERFFLGGRTTVRGYEQDTLGPKGVDGNPTGGNAFLMGNMEMRSYLSRNFGVAAFFDCGNVWVKIKDMNPDDLKYTTGLGLRYNTPVGPLRLDYGHKLRRETGESRGELHFSIGHPF